MPMTLTKEEKAAVLALKRIAKKWPASLWLLSFSGSLCVMKKDERGQVPMSKIVSDEFDMDYCVADIKIENDGCG
jgi:hypothetical protein